MDFYANILLPTTATFTCDELIRCKVCLICLLLLPSTPLPTSLPQKQFVYWTRSTFQQEAPANGIVVSPGLAGRHVYNRMELNVAMGSVVHFMCPDLAQNEHYLIYKVSAADYESCSTEATRRKRATPFLRCTGSAQSGGQPQRRALQIAELNPFGRGYKAGQEIHFITTSSGSPLGIDNMHDGACRKYDMRVKLTVQKPRQPEERYRSCLRILGVQPECCEPRNRLSYTCAAPTTPEPASPAQAGFFLSQPPSPNSSAPSNSICLESLASFVISSLVSRLLRRFLDRHF